MTTTDAPTEPGSFALTAKIHAELETQSTELRRVRRSLEHSEAMQPVRRTFPAVVVIPANQVGVAWFGGPDMGHVWFVHGLVIGGLTPPTVVAGRADVFVAATDLRVAAAAGGLGAIGTQDWRDQLGAMPVSKFYGHDLHVRAPEDFFVVISNATAGQSYVVVASIEDVQEGLATPIYSG